MKKSKDNEDATILNCYSYLLCKSQTGFVGNFSGDWTGGDVSLGRSEEIMKFVESAGIKLKHSNNQYGCSLNLIARKITAPFTSHFCAHSCFKCIKWNT